MINMHLIVYLCIIDIIVDVTLEDPSVTRRWLVDFIAYRNGNCSVFVLLRPVSRVITVMVDASGSSSHLCHKIVSQYWSKMALSLYNVY
jgi:hypothetical protein